MTIALRTFIYRATEPTQGAGSIPFTSPFPSDSRSKHVRMAYDPVYDRVVSSGGDIASSGGEKLMFDYDPVADSEGAAHNGWARHSGPCHAAGQISPWWAMVDDPSPFFIDLKRNRRLIFPASTTAGSGSLLSPCTYPVGPSGSTYKVGVLNQDPVTRQWSTVVDETSNYPTYSAGGFNPQMHLVWDPVRDVLICTGSDNNIQIRTAAGPPFTILTQVPYARYNGTFQNSTVGYTAVPNGYIWGYILDLNPTWGIDVIGRKLYMTAVGQCCTSIGGAGNVDFRTIVTVVLDLDTYVLSYLGIPPLQFSPGVGNSAQNSLGNAPCGVFDTRNRAYILFFNRDEVGVVEDVFVYPVATGAWERYSVVSDTPSKTVTGTSWVYHPKQNLCIGGGTEFGSPQNTVWWWRYA